MDADRAPLTQAGANTPPRRLRAGLAAIPVVFVGVLYGWPVVTLAARLLSPGALVESLRLPGVPAIVWFTFWQAVVSTVATLIVGIGPAFLLARWDFRGRSALRALVTVPFLLPTVVVGAAFVSLLPDGASGSTAAIVAAHVFFNIAVVVRVVGALWAQLPQDLASAARCLGATPAQVWREITLPLLRPALVSAATVVFLFTFTSFGAVQILGGASNPTIEVEIARRALQLGDVRGAAALSVLQLLFLVVVIVVAARVQRRGRVALPLAPAPARSATSRRQRIAVTAGVLVTATAIGAPLAALVVSSLRVAGRWTLVGWRGLGGGQEVRPGLGLGVDARAAIARSVTIAAASTAVAVVVGALAACAIAVARRRGRLLDAGVMLPLGTSAVTIGLGMLITFDRAPVDWRGEPWLVPLGHALVAVPFVVRTVVPVLAARPSTWLDAAATLGATPTRAWWEIDAQLVRRPLLIAAAFAAAVSLGEFGATSFLSRSGQETMPLAIARLLSRAGDIPRAQAFALATILAVVTTVLIVVVDAFDHHRADAGRRRG